jgi:hypothetical protein
LSPITLRRLAEGRLDGIFVLRTSAELVARSYNSLWRVERTFQEVKSTLNVRSIYHQRDETCAGHIVVSFLALRLEVDLRRRLVERCSRSLGRSSCATWLSCRPSTWTLTAGVIVFALTCPARPVLRYQPPACPLHPRLPS